jgi:hypothetical protein
MSATEIWTYQDIVEHLLDVFDSERAGRPLRIARRASAEALRELSSCYRWSYYDSSRILRTVAAYSTGSITYDNTGGTSENLVTLAGGTFPSSDVRYYRMIIAGIHYPINSYIDSTNVTLSANENPGADLAAGTSYQIYRNSYPLPVGFVEIGELYDITNEVPIPIVQTDKQHRDSIFWFDTPDTPWQASIRNDQEFLNSLSLVFGPPPNAAVVYGYTYHRSPRQLLTEKYATGTVSVSGGSTTCSITTGAFTTAHIGCVIRFGTSALEPDNVFGGITDTDTACTDQRVIVSVASNGTSCVLDAAPAAAISAVKFTVSDPVDIEHTAMLTAYQRMAEAAYTRLSKREQKDRNDRESAALMALRLAIEKDNRAVKTMANVHYDPFTHTNVTTDV